MTLIVPPGVPADGTVLLKFVPAFADTASPKMATEANAAGALDLTCYVDPSSFGYNNDQDTITDDRLCAKTSYEQPGRSKWSLDNLLYIMDPQNPASASNKAYATLAPNTAGFLLVRWGLDVDLTALAASQIVDVVPIKTGAQVKQKPEANSVLKVQQKFFVTGPISFDVPLAP